MGLREGMGRPVDGGGGGGMPMARCEGEEEYDVEGDVEEDGDGVEEDELPVGGSMATAAIHERRESSRGGWKSSCLAEVVN